MFHREMDELMRKADSLQCQRRLVSLVLVSLQQQIEKPIVEVIGAGRWDIEQEFGFWIWVTDDPNLRAEFVAIHTQLGYGRVVEVVYGLRPLSLGVIPEDQAVPLKYPLQAFVDSVHRINPLPPRGRGWGPTLLQV